MTVEIEQQELPLRPRPVNAPQDVPLDVIMRQPSRLAAIRLQVASAGLTEGQIAAALNIAPAQWSRIMSGQAHFPTEKWQLFHQVTGNHVTLLYDVARAGFDPASLRPLMSDIERQLEAERARSRELEKELGTIKKFIRETRTHD